jgi:hypothetical protein
VCPVCKFTFTVKKRGPVPDTCSDRCALALALHRAYRHGVDKPVALLKKDIAAKSFQIQRVEQRRQQRRQRYQEIIDGMLTGVLRRRK